MYLLPKVPTCDKIAIKKASVKFMEHSAKSDWKDDNKLIHSYQTVDGGVRKVKVWEKKVKACKGKGTADRSGYIHRGLL